MSLRPLKHHEVRYIWRNSMRHCRLYRIVEFIFGCTLIYIPFFYKIPNSPGQTPQEGGLLAMEDRQWPAQEHRNAALRHPAQRRL